jgi:GGDEF domain-containing protein
VTMFLRSLKEDAAVRQSSNEPDERILAMLRRAEPAALLVVVITTVLTIGLWFIPRFAAFNKSAAQEFPLSFSVGLAELNPGSSESLEDLVATADARMYEDKTQKKLRAAVLPADIGSTLKTDLGGSGTPRGAAPGVGVLAGAATDH